jgi:aspartyl-tRNA synthetase
LEIETPFLIKSTPEGARDFVVPSRLNENEFYALPQSPQTFKQLLMVSGFEKYFQIVKCFRDEDLRADRQPEFTQIDCEMSFVTQEDILNTFEGLTKHLFKTLKDVELPDFQRMPYSEAMAKYGIDKPDVRFGMEFVDFADVAKNKGFNVFDAAEAVLGINAKGCAEYTRKQLDKLTDFVKSQQVGAKGLVYVKCNADGSFKSSVDKFFSQEDLAEWAKAAGAEAGDLLLLLSGDLDATRKQLGVLRLHMGDELGLRTEGVYKPLWVVDFPLVEWDEDSERWHAMHHPFTSPKAEDMDKLQSDLGSVNADAYDLVINGVEIGGGSIRIHDKDKQALVFKALGMSDEESREKFGFLLDAFQYGAPPHGGIAFGFDRLCAMFGGSESIRDYIAFPKNNQGRDVMLDAPSPVDQEQLDELKLALK